MTDVAIHCEGLAKQYRIGERERYRALRDVITDAVTAPFRRVRSARRDSSNGNGSNEETRFWALKDVSFEIKRGEVVGIIGRNGAGKSTLLKILSRITEPTRGSADIWGRVGSLLEVGTGFHPELTGRDNIFLNGAILGMKRAETARKFDEIVSFAEVEKFIDTPVKRYSSGMYVRLAFAVAAHMETEILLVDEVLAVGDAEFQKKCVGKMGEVAKHGRTVLFVSHSIPSIQRLCQRGVLLSCGDIEYDGPVNGAIEAYMTTKVSSEYVASGSPHEPRINFATVQWSKDTGIVLELRFTSPFELIPPVVGIVLLDASGVPVYGTNTRFEVPAVMPASMQSGTVRVLIPTDALRPDTYRISLWLADQFQDHCQIENAVQVDVGLGANEALRPPRSTIGSVRLATRWIFLPDLQDAETSALCEGSGANKA